MGDGNRSTRSRLTRAGLLGDIHAEDVRLARALELFRHAQVETVLFVGDVVDGEGDVERCLALLTEAHALGVRGNHERWILGDTMRTLPHAHRLTDLSSSSIDLLRALPTTRTFTCALGEVLLCHGVGDDDMQRLRPSDDAFDLRNNHAFENLRRQGEVAVLLGGHTHERMVRDFGDLVAINAGTLAREQADAGCIVVDFDLGRAEFHRFDGTELRPDGAYPIEPGRSFVVPSHG